MAVYLIGQGVSLLLLLGFRGECGGVYSSHMFYLAFYRTYSRGDGQQQQNAVQVHGIFQGVPCNTLVSLPL